MILKVAAYSRGLTDLVSSWVRFGLARLELVGGEVFGGGFNAEELVIEVGRGASILG